MSTSSKVNLCDLPYPDLERFVVEELGAKKFRAAQLWQWIWVKNAAGFDVMTDISQGDREKLALLAEIRWPSIADVRVSSDGTTKFLLELADGELVETVMRLGEKASPRGCSSVRRESMTFFRLSSGSPMPMYTILRMMGLSGCVSCT